MEEIVEPKDPKKYKKEIFKNIEAILFVANQEVSPDDIEKVINKSLDIELEREFLLELMAELSEKYESDEYSFTLMEISDGYRFLSKSEYHKSISHLVQVQSRKRLSNANMETLAIIAYKQPVTKGQIEEIRGVNCDYSVQKLLEKELVTITGRSDSVGKPLLYGTSKQFMNHFGLKSIKDLPKLKEVIPQHNEIGSEQKEEIVPNQEGQQVTEETNQIAESGELDQEKNQQGSGEHGGGAPENEIHEIKATERKGEEVPPGEASPKSEVEGREGEENSDEEE